MMKELQKLLWYKDSIRWDGPKHHIPCLAHIINLAVKAFLSNLKIGKLNDEHEWTNRSRIDKEQSQNNGNADDDDDISLEEDDEIDDNDDDDDFIINETNDFASTLQKLRTIARTANFPQGRILAFEQFCAALGLKCLRPIRDHAIRWSATYNMLERAVYLRRAIDAWTRSKPIYANLILGEREWEMAEFLMHFLYPFKVINTMVQGTAKPSLHDTWIRYEDMF